MADGRADGISVTPRPGEPIDRLVRRFTNKVRNSKILDEWRLRSHFESRTEKRRRKQSLARFKRSQQEE